MRKIMSAAVLAAITPAFGADIEPKAAVDCFLSIASRQWRTWQALQK
jgi:hypothetical protein